MYLLTEAFVYSENDTRDQIKLKGTNYQWCKEILPSTIIIIITHLTNTTQKQNQPHCYLIVDLVLHQSVLLMMELVKNIHRQFILGRTVCVYPIL